MSHGVHPAIERARLTGRPVADRDRELFLAAYAPLFEQSPWVAERAWELRPFDDAKALHRALLQVIAEASREERLSLARAHPPLAAAAREPAGAGLDRMPPAEFRRFQTETAAYLAKHGFPFIICAKLNSRGAILEALRARLEQDTDSELDEAMTQLGLISRLRLAEVRV